MENNLTVRFKRGGRRPKSHGGYSFLVKGDLPENRNHILKYLMAVREGLTRDLQDSGKGLTTAQIVLIDRITSLLGVVRCMEEHVREHSVFEGDELAPCLRASYLAYNNSLRLDLQALGIEQKNDVFLAPYEIVADEASKEGPDEHR